MDRYLSWFFSQNLEELEGSRARSGRGVVGVDDRVVDRGVGSHDDGRNLQKYKEQTTSEITVAEFLCWWANVRSG